MLLPGLEDGVVHGVGVARVVDDLVAELPGHPKARDQAVDAGDLALDETEVGQRFVGNIDVGDLFQDAA